ncbi:hypothetical protein PG995_009683 [Apiospora arundinis]
MDPNNPLADREKSLENQWIKNKEQQMAKDRAAQAAKGAKDQGQGQQGGQAK